MRGKNITKVVLLDLERAHRLPGRYKRQKRTFQTIMKHFEKKNSNFRQNFHIKIDSQSFQHDIWISTRNYLANPYYEGRDFTCSEGNFLEI